MGSNLRLRDSTNRVEELINYAHQLGHKGLCITDHESVTAHLNALQYFESKKDEQDWKGFKLGLGNEIYLCKRTVTAENVKNNVYPHFILIALDAEGHRGIRELSTRAWTKNAFMYVMYRVPTYYSDLEEMMQKYRGHIIGCTACLGGQLPIFLLKERMNPQQGFLEKAKIWISKMEGIFGHGYFFLEMQPSDNEEQIYVNNQLLKLSDEMDIPYLISTDAHYLKKEDRPIHKAFLNSQEGDREVDAFYATTYVMSEKEIHSYMDKHLGKEVVRRGLDNTMLIYEKIQPYVLTKPLKIPYLPKNLQEPDGELLDKYLDKIPLLSKFADSPYNCDRHLVREVLIAVDKDPYYQTEQAFDKINECFSYIEISSEKNHVRWSAYLLQVADYVNIAWESGSLVGVGRGSGVGFCLLNLLGITQINPLREKTQTFPWRFLNPERASVLDIDIDIMSNKRDIIIQHMKDAYGEDRVSKVMTLSTEKSKSAILTAARGLGISNDIASYIASLIIYDRGQPRSLYTMYYGNEDTPRSEEFVREIDAVPKLWETAKKIEGLVCGVGSHAGGVIIVDEPFTESTALMRTKSGDVITQFDLHMCEKVSLIKIDLLSINALDKMSTILSLLEADKIIEWQGSLKNTYEKYIGVYTLERDDEKMWKMLWEHKVLNFFQMEKESGKQAISLVKPRSVDDLATLNSVLRLMPQEKGAESPLHKYARFKNDITQWYDEMTLAGLNQEEQEILKGILGVSCGICEAQEYLFLLVMHPKIGGFSLSWAERLRKAVAKKNPKDFEELEREFFENAQKKRLSDNLVKYAWNVLISTQRGYGFNKSHTLAYSIIGLQELNLCYKYNPIYWQTANLIVDSGSLDEQSNDATKYGKMAVAIALIQHEGVKIAPPTVNEAGFSFVPDTKNNQIIFGLKGINGINTEISQMILQGKPYSSIEEFAEKFLDTKIIKPAQMLKLIKGGCFKGIHSSDKRETMEWYLRKYLFIPCEKLTMQQFSRIEEFHILSSELELPAEIVRYKKYVLDESHFYKKHVDSEKKRIPKCGYHDRYFLLDDEMQEFFKKNFSEDSIEGAVNGHYFVSEKKFKKEADKLSEPIKEWLDNPATLQLYNEALFQKLWEERALGNESSWSMDALSYYDGEHELANVDENIYGIFNFYELPKEPEPYDYYTRYVNGQPKLMPKYRISRIAGTVLNADSNRRTVSLSTLYGVVNVKFSKGHYAFYNKRISAKLNPSNDTKTILENSWFQRGNKLLVTGIRRDDQFWPLVYNDTIYKHRVNLIKEIYPNGKMLLQSERTKLEDLV